MKRKLLYIVLLWLAGIGAAFGQVVNIPDSNFLNALINIGVDKNGDKLIQESEVLTVKNLDLRSSPIQDLTGIQYFTSLENLNCSQNKLLELDVSQNKLLKILDCSGNFILKKLNVSGALALNKLTCSSNSLDSLNLVENTNLTELDCGYNLLKDLCLSQNVKLTWLDCSKTLIDTLNLSYNINLRSLSCLYNNLISLDLSKNPLLVVLSCEDGKLEHLNLENNKLLKQLNCYRNKLISLDLSHNVNLTQIACSNNPLKRLNVSNNIKAEQIECIFCELDSLDIRNNKLLKSLYITGNNLTKIDLSSNSQLKDLDCSQNNLGSLDVSLNYNLINITCVLNTPLKEICINKSQLEHTRIWDFYKSGAVKWNTNCGKYLENSDTLSISGLVHQGSGLLSDGIVLAIEKASGKTHFKKVSNGAFTIDSLRKTEYILYAVPNPVSVPGYASTYYVNKLKLSDAVTLNLIGHIKETDIYLVPISKKENGTSKIQGRFSYDDENTDDTTSFAKNWFAGLSTPKSEIQISTQPCKNMPVLLYNGGNEIINSTITDTEGYYGFNDLSGGKYKLAGQRYGYQTENQGEIMVSVNTEEVTSLRMIKLTTGLDDKSLNQSSTGTYAYPNPFQYTIEIRGYQGNISVSDITGSVYYEAPSSQSINTRNWPSGVYFLKAGNLVQKIIKQ